MLQCMMSHVSYVVDFVVALWSNRCHLRGILLRLQEVNTAMAAALEVYHSS